MENLWLIPVAIITYLTCSFSFAKAITGKTSEEWGGDSWGAMSTLAKTGSKLKFILVVAGDALKGFLVVFLFASFAKHVGYNDMLALFVTATAAVVGHVFSGNLNFRGGRGLATGWGVMMAVNWLLGLVCAGTIVVSILAFEFLMEKGLKGKFLDLLRRNILGRFVGVMLCLVPIFALEGTLIMSILLPMIMLILYAHRERLQKYLDQREKARE